MESTFLKLEDTVRPFPYPEEFCFAVIGLSHPHIYAMCEGLISAGSTLKWVFDEDNEAAVSFQKRFPQANRARSIDEILLNPQVRLVAGDSIPEERCAVGLRVLDAGKDYLCDKVPMLSLEDLKTARKTAARTGRKYMVYYGERLSVEGEVYAGQLVRNGAIGRVLHLAALGPHRLNEGARPDWFFHKARCGGILCDLGSHQIDQFLTYCDVKDAHIAHCRAANLNHPQYPDWDDLGEATLIGENGASCYFRVDWFTPDGLRAWGDSRTFLLGTEGAIEVRKYIDIARGAQGNHVFLTDRHGERHFSATGKVGLPFFPHLIYDCINRTEYAMTQEHAFCAAELCLRVQMKADNLV